MWDLRNLTSYAARSSWTRDVDGTHRWLVCVKATFDVQPRGATTLADEQPEPLLLPEYFGEPGTSSIRYDIDVVPEKPTTDLVVNATGYAPQQRPARDFMVMLRLGPIIKTLMIHGDRYFTETLSGLGPSRATPVTEVPIRYERAYGGYDCEDPDPAKHRLEPRNPVGRGIARRAASLVGKPVANVEYPTGSPANAGPAGFGAIDGSWSPRRELQGTYDAAWLEHRRPLLPVDWSPQSLLCSPADQRPPQYLRGGELVELGNVTPEGTFRVELPKVFLGFKTRVDGRVEEHRARLGTVIVEPDDRKLIMVWQTSIPVRGNPDYLDETTIYEKTHI